MFMPEGKLDLGTPPRHCYPLVIFLIRDTPANSTLHPDETVRTIYFTISIKLIIIYLLYKCRYINYLSFIVYLHIIIIIHSCSVFES